MLQLKHFKYNHYFNLFYLCGLILSFNTGIHYNKFKFLNNNANDNANDNDNNMISNESSDITKKKEILKKIKKVMINIQNYI
tara:strand:- start:80 stop:325 length:246 start_codon:yes stop_codon:yes gene_type:complete